MGISPAGRLSGWWPARKGYTENLNRGGCKMCNEICYRCAGRTTCGADAAKEWREEESENREVKESCDYLGG
ncbi:MAG: hypothetical protein WC623_24125 [Pedobacter sp.]|uniref:hypothetical protein n=1 Tax=Pedobacter sp. TaxID=1411316 RepID=UPI003561C7F6